ncbi:bacterial transcriptional activator domain-containing protein [Actinomycetospora endophytica]|uniref:Bacterial transcriptional activator domain-containing protein n=1 Tax=Actinomycetospora endophytica TaxID=2291215 RepID=A0ABS8P6E0_9PSEU|nr:bacterial transcriptional activator domain-containing protein [Actinomycetospora endophytica]MCD2193806.1 bacterial transcriptional activator domain-containing protein [Actinomycetospora endophytica]
MRIQLHGRFAVAVGGRTVSQHLPGRRARLLVAVLAAADRCPVDRGALLDLLWCPSSPGEGAAATFAALLSKVRTVIAPAEIRGRRSLDLVLPHGSIVDAAVARAALHAAESAAARRDWPVAWTEALSALFVTQRGFLADFDDPWSEDRRREALHRHRRVLACYGEACLHLGPGERSGAERSARALIELDPLAESGHRLLMRALVAQGDRSAALQAYERMRRLLREELGAGPGAASRELHTEILG